MAQIKFKKDEIEIIDSAKQQAQLIWFLLIITLLQSVVFFITKPFEKEPFLTVFWIVLGLFSLITMTFLLTKRTTNSRIKKTGIHLIRSQSGLTGNKLIFKLVAGKSRVIFYKKESEFLADITKLKSNNYEVS
jgi:hypothetical protein